MERDDLLVLIHKALRHGLFQVTLQAGATDWTDPDEVEALRQRWETVAGLVRDHAGHEDRHIFALLESKQPGVTGLLGIGHDRVEAELLDVDARFSAAIATLDPARGRDAYLALTQFVATALVHFADEEPEVMDRIWATCTDEEIAQCRAAFMAEISPPQSVATTELMIPASAPRERAAVIGKVRATAPPVVYETILEVAARTLTLSQMAQLQAELDRQTGAPVTV